MIVERIVEAAAGRFAVSRALDPRLKRQLLARTGTSELPCVQGRTVVPDTCCDTVVVGHPNHLGVFDRVGGGRTIMLTGAWSQLRPVPEGVSVVAVESAVPGTVAQELLAEVRRLAKRLRQLRGVQVAIRPQSPVAVVLLPFSPGTCLRALPGVTALDRNFPEYPGGVRIELSVDAVGFDLTRYAASLERLIMEEA